MRKHFYTFGCGQPFAKYHVEFQVDAKTIAEAATLSRPLMARYFGACWCTDYPEKVFKDLQKTYGETKPLLVVSINSLGDEYDTLVMPEGR